MQDKSLLQRRSFLEQSLLVGAAGVISTQAYASPSSNMCGADIDEFQRCVGEAFAVRGNSAYDTSTSGRSLVLEAVQPVPVAKADVRYGRNHPLRSEPFYLQFSAPAGTDLNQGTYSLSHPLLAETDLFLVREPSASTDGTERYIVAFN